MTAKAYLAELRRLDACINQRLQEKAALYASTVKASRTGDPVHASGGRDAMPGLIQRLTNLEADIDRRIDAFVNRKHRIIQQIQELDNAAYVSLLYKRYVEYKRLEQIAAEMHYTYQHIRVLHGKALRAFEQRYAAEIKAASKSGNTKQHSDVL